MLLSSNGLALGIIPVKQEAPDKFVCIKYFANEILKIEKRIPCIVDPKSQILVCPVTHLLK